MDETSGSVTRDLSTVRLVQRDLKKTDSGERKWRKLDEYFAHCVNSVSMALDIWNVLQRNWLSVQLPKQKNEESII